jgi:transposase
MSKTKRARYTLEFKLEAARLVKAGQSVTKVAATLDVPAQPISNWVKAEQEDKPGGAGTKPVSPEQMELSRLRAEVARLKMERDILKNVWSAPGLQGLCSRFDRTSFASMYPACSRSSRLLAVMESAHT